MKKVLVFICLVFYIQLTYSGERISQQASLSGEGTVKSPYLIKTIADLKWMRDQVNAEATNAAYGDKYYKLMNALDFSSETSWEAIGNRISNTSLEFRGHFDGNGKVIRNLKLGVSASEPYNKGIYVGLFGYVQGGAITNLGIVDVSIYAAQNYAGCLVGYLEKGNITNCYSTGVFSNAKVSRCSGGIVGYNSAGSIANCYSTATIYGNEYVGGIAGQNFGTITNCFTKAFISSHYGYTVNAGGIAGYNGGQLTNCYSHSNVEAGIAGTSSTSGASYYAGGIAGFNRKMIDRCYVLGGDIKCVSYYSYCLFPRVIAYFDSGAYETWGNYYVQPEPPYYLLYTSQSWGSYYPIKDIPSNMGNGGGTLRGAPEDELNKWVTENPVTVSGQILSKWKVEEGLNGGAPFFDNSTVFWPSVFQGEGIRENPYQIGNEVDLWTLSSLVASDNATWSSKCYKLTNDIDYSNGRNWYPIGTSLTPFKGVFDGNGKTISNINIGTAEAQINIRFAGLFGYIDGGNITDLTVGWSVSNAHCSADEFYSGGIAGYALNSTFENCCTSGSLSLVYKVGDNRIGAHMGGIVGYATTSVVNDCCSAAEISISHSAKNRAGGIVGSNPSGLIVNSCFTGKMTAAVNAAALATSYVGGIAGDNFSGKIYNSYVTADVSSYISSSRAGGIAGDNSYGEIYNSYASGSIISSIKQNYITYAGGIAGISESGTVDNCLALNPRVTAINETSSTIAKPARIASGLADGANFAFENMVVEYGTNENSLIRLTSFTGKSHGSVLTAEPVDVLNNWLTLNPKTEGITNRVWIADAQINNGYPVFGAKPSSVTPSLMNDSKFLILPQEAGIRVISEEEGLISVVSIDGKVIKESWLPGGEINISLPKGLFIVKTPDYHTHKIIIR